jgi:F-box and WD-40 domain protein CDC4
MSANASTSPPTNKLMFAPAPHNALMESTHSSKEVGEDMALALFDRLTSTQKDRYLSLLVHKLSRRQLALVANSVMPRLRVDILALAPLEISLHILSYLPVHSLCRVASCSRAHWALVQDSQLWRKLCQYHGFQPVDSGKSSRSASFHQLPRQLQLRNRTLSLPLTPCSSQQDIGDAMSFDFKRVFIAHYTVRRNWNIGRCTHFSIDGPRAAIVTCLQFDDDQLIIATDNASYGLIELYNTVTGERVRRISGHEGGVWALDFMGNVLVSGGCDRDVRVWDIKTGTMLHRMHGHTSTVRCLKIIDDQICVTGSRDHTLRVWDLQTGECMHVLRGHEGSIRCLAVFGDLVVSGSYDNTLKIWNYKTGALVHTLDEHHAQIYSVSFDGQYVCSGSLDADVRVWNAVTGECLFILEGHDALVGHMQLNGTTLVTGGSDGRICIWNIETGKCLIRINAHVNSVTTLQFDEERILSGGDDGVKLWCLRTGTLIRHVIDGASGVWRLQAAANRLVAAVQHGDLTSIEVLISFV